MIPPHDGYIECFAGKAAVLWRKRPAARSIAIDLSPGRIAELSEERSRVTTFAPRGPIAGDGDAVPLLELIVGDGVEYIKHFLPGPLAVFVYADPPYVRSSRADPDRDYYEHEWTDADHERFLDVADGLACMVMISGYESALYASRLARPKWRCSRFQTMTRGGPAEESVWMNYAAPDRLHDYRYIGHRFRDRERIRKRQRSWLRMLDEMAPLEREAMIAAVLDAYGDGGSLQCQNF